jgi:hypothetical protein
MPEQTVVLSFKPLPDYNREKESPSKKLTRYFIE